VTAVRCWFLSHYGQFGLSNPCVTRDSSSLIISESLGLFGLWNPCVTPDSTSLIISESLGAVWAVESMCHPWQQFVAYFYVPRAVWAVESMRHPWQQFVDVLFIKLISVFLGLYPRSSCRYSFHCKWCNSKCPSYFQGEVSTLIFSHFQLITHIYTS
jgi:hypothetical protein